TAVCETAATPARAGIPVFDGTAVAQQIQQTPPMYSAVKVQGKPAYLSARQGKDLNLKPKTISIYQIDILDFSSPLLTLKIHCSKGTYIRSLAHDIGRALGIGAYLDDLVRTQIGAYTLDDSFEISSLIQYLENLDLNNSL
ncbi:MAG: hypothetical protein MUE53_07620, partial [Chitinophagales bacterium]|nr:hypothetical protein [Chitinophagales bacterium]